MSLLRFAGLFFSTEDFPPLQKFRPENLPTWHEVVRRICTCITEQGKQSNAKSVCAKVAKELEVVWVSKNVYPIAEKNIVKRIFKKYGEFLKLRNSFYTGTPTVKSVLLIKEEKRNDQEKEKVEKWQKKYYLFIDSLTELCDLKCEDKSRIKTQENVYGVKMSKDEDHFYEMQKQKDWRWKCDKKVDDKWLLEKKREVGRQKYYEKKIEEANNQFKMVSSLTEIEDDPMSDHEALDVDYVPQDCNENSSRQFSKCADEDSVLPESMRYVRKSERKVLPEFYEFMQSLCGMGLSTDESMKAFVIVSNIFYKNNFKMPCDGQADIDKKTLPHRTTVLQNLNLGEVKRLDMIVQKIESLKKDQETMLTMAQDSTTRKQVGTYSTSGIHLGKNIVVPLPTLGVTSETSKNVAETHATHLEILAAAGGTSASEVYKSIDCHMTDSVSHNKHIAADLAEMFDRDQPAGQVFCNIHTSLGISRAINSGLSEIEAEMGVENIFKSVLVEVTYEKKHGSVVAQAVYAVLALIDAEHSAKTWNKHAEFLSWLKQHDIEPHFFQYRDDRFDGLAHGCALVLYLWDHVFAWLSERTDINNRLACYVRSMEKVPYLKISLAVFASFGIQLIEPFNATMFSNKTTHTSLIEFYSPLMQKLNDQITEKFFNFEQNVFGFCQEYFDGCKMKYHPDVVKSVRDVSKNNLDDCINLSKFVMPGIRKTIISQRGGEYGFGPETSDFPIETQAKNIDDIPHHNLQMESYCGRVAALVNKYGTLASASRSMIFHGTEFLKSECMDKSVFISRSLGYY